MRDPGGRPRNPMALTQMKKNLEILYEDNHLIAVYKPAGILVQGDASGGVSLMDVVKNFLKVRDHKTGNVFLGLLHRLDRPVQGIVLFAKTSKGASRLSEQFREHTIQKIYHAIVKGVPRTPHATLVHWIHKDEQKNAVVVFDAPNRGALRAELSYEVVKSARGQALLKINLKTGRPHQIRAQLSYIGHPIVGDTKYGGEKNAVLKLAATQLTFETATTHEEVVVKLPIPF